MPPRVIYTPAIFDPWQPIEPPSDQPPTELANDQEDTMYDDPNIIEMTDAEFDGVAAAMDAEDPEDAVLDVLAGMALADDQNADPVGELDERLADFTPYVFEDADAKARMQQTDRDEYLRRGVPSTLVELGLPLLYSASAKVRTQGQEILERAEGVEYDSDQYNFIAVALHDLLDSQGLHPNAKAYGRATREDSPSIDQLNDAMDARYGITTRVHEATRGDGSPLDAGAEDRKRAYKKAWRAAKEQDRRRATEIGTAYDFD